LRRLSYAKICQITSDHAVDDQAQSRLRLLSAGLAANERRISVLDDPWLYADGTLSPSHSLLVLFQGKFENDCQLATSTGTVVQAASSHEGTDACYHADIARLVKARWRFQPNLNGYPLSFVVHWEVENFITQCLGGDGDLREVLTVTGNSRSAYGATCQQYVYWQWGTIGVIVLDLVCRILRTPRKRYKTSMNIANRHDIELTFERSNLPGCRVNVSASSTANSPVGYSIMVAISVVQMLAWMASVFRMPKEGSPHCSSIVLSSELPHGIDIKLGNFASVTRTESSCWHDLLPNTTVAIGFPVRNQESDLDVAWDLMLDLADVIFHTDLSKFDLPPPLGIGIFYNGVNTLLYPVSKSGTVMKWHFDTSGKTAVPPPANFLRVESEQMFTESEHLVGFAAQSEIQLGTRKRIRDYARMTSVVGCIERGRPEIALDAFSAAIGKAPATATVGVKVKFPSTLRATVDPQKRRYDDIVKKTKDQAVILYDCGVQRGAWLVPQLSVILDLVCYRMYKEQWGEPPKYPLALANGGAAAFQVLRDPLVYLHKLSSILEDNSDFRIMDLVKEIYEAMLKRRILHEAPASGSWMLHRERLHGWDLLEIADAPDQSFRREIEVHQTTSRAIAQYPSWLPLTQHIPVYLGQDLGHVISVGNQPLPMRHVKNREKCLVANVHTLQTLLRNRDECSDFHLDCELVWELPSSVASMFLGMTGVSEDPTSSERIEHCLQRLQKSKDHVCTLRNERTTLCGNDLVIFGPETTKLSRFNELVDSLAIGASEHCK
jgi:hypothetical protein